MISPFIRMVAFRYLRARRKEGFISVIAAFSFLGIALGVGTLIVVMAVMNGFHNELMSRILGINAHLSLFSETRALTGYDNLTERLKKLEGVTDVAPVIEGQVMAAGIRASNGAIVRGMRREDLQRKTVVSERVIAGKFEEFGDPNAILMGKALARNLGVEVGDVVKLISPETTATVIGAIPRLKEYRIAGIFDIGMYEYDSSTIFMPLDAAQLYFRLPQAVNRIDIMTKDPHNVDKVGRAIAEATRGQYAIQDWQRANSSYFGAIKVERNVMFLILTLIILVAAFNIISSLIMLVKDKGRDIAILRTMGATRSMIMRIFILCGSMIGVIGTLLGFLLGLAFALNIESIRQGLQKLTGTELFSAEIYYLSQLPAEVQTGDVVSVVLMSLALSLLATIYPAWRASRLDPVEGVRYE